MAWGDGKPEGNGGNSCPHASHPPTPLALGRSTSLCRRTSSEGSSSVEWPHSHLSTGKSSFQHPPVPSRRDANRCECSSGRVRRLKATVFFVALRRLTLP